MNVKEGNDAWQNFPPNLWLNNTNINAEEQTNTGKE